MILLMQPHLMLWEPFIGPSLKAMRALLSRLIQGYGGTTSFSYPDTWVRKPDCLHLPYRGYNGVCQGLGDRGNVGAVGQRAQYFGYAG